MSKAKVNHEFVDESGFKRIPGIKIGDILYTTQIPTDVWFGDEINCERYVVIWVDDVGRATAIPLDTIAFEMLVENDKAFDFALDGSGVAPVKVTEKFFLTLEEATVAGINELLPRLNDFTQWLIDTRKEAEQQLKVKRELNTM